MSETQTTAQADPLAVYLDRLLDNEAWASSGTEAADHIRSALGYTPPLATEQDRRGQAAMAGAVTSAADIAANDNGTKRVSHADLMLAVEYLSAAAQKEMNAGNRSRAMEINSLILATFKAAIRVEDLS